MSDDRADLRIRAATVEDAAALAALRYRFRSALGTPTEAEARFVARAHAWLAARLGQTSWLVWVAIADREIVGHCFVQLIEKIPNPVDETELIAYITNVFVVPERRGQGIGTRLLRTALDACREHAVDTTVLWATPESRSLYLRHGFAPPAHVLERPAH